jgi:hypothetical protein
MRLTLRLAVTRRLALTGHVLALAIGVAGAARRPGGPQFLSSIA